jgi:hypothetical protein
MEVRQNGGVSEWLLLVQQNAVERRWPRFSLRRYVVDDRVSQTFDYRTKEWSLVMRRTRIQTREDVQWPTTNELIGN